MIFGNSGNSGFTPKHGNWMNTCRWQAGCGNRIICYGIPMPW